MGKAYRHRKRHNLISIPTDFSISASDIWFLESFLSQWAASQTLPRGPFLANITCTTSSYSHISVTMIDERSNMVMGLCIWGKWCIKPMKTKAWNPNSTPASILFVFFESLPVNKTWFSLSSCTPAAAHVYDIVTRIGVDTYNPTQKANQSNQNILNVGFFVSFLVFVKNSNGRQQQVEVPSLKYFSEESEQPLSRVAKFEFIIINRIQVYEGLMERR